MKSEKILFHKGRNALIYIVYFFLLFLSLLAVVKSLFTGFDIDESYAVAQAYRLITGDRLFYEMWEPHQLSAFGSAIFMAPFLAVTGGDTTGIVLYLRIVGTVIHLLIGGWFFCEAKDRFGRGTGVLVFLIYMNFLPKWITLPEFEIMQYWSVCVIFLALLRWNRRQSPIYLLISGLAFCVLCSTYPTMIVLYFVYAYYVLRPGNTPSQIQWKSLLWLTLPIALVGGVFLLYLSSYMTLSDFLENVSCILADDSHSVSLAVRGEYYIEELGQFGEMLLGYLPAALLAVLLFYLPTWRKMGRSIKQKSFRNTLILQCLQCLTVAFILRHALDSFAGGVNQFYLYFRFLLIVLLGTAGYLMHKTECREYFWLGILPGLTGWLASTAITNMTSEIALARVYVGVMATCFVMGELLRDRYRKEKLLKAVSFCTAASFILGLLICKLLLIRITGCLPVSVKMNLSLVTEGPAAGLYVEQELAEQYNVNFPLIDRYIEESDCFLYFGCENIYYMKAGARIASPSTQGTTVFDEIFLRYYELHPDRIPNVVIIDKTFESNPYYNYSYKNAVVLEWIEENFQDAERVETEYFIILRK